MRAASGSLLVLALLLLPTALSLPAGTAGVVPGPAAGPRAGSGARMALAPGLTLLPHPKILIHGDAMFRLGPAVGVLNPLASGAPEDPYVISGWDVSPDLGAPVDVRESEWLGNIQIENTTKSFVVRDSFVHGHHSPPPSDPFWSALHPVASQVDDLAGHLGIRFGYAGIQLTNAPYGRVENVTIADNDVGLLATDTWSLVLKDLRVHGNAPTWSPAEGAGIVIADSPDARVEGGSIADEPVGVEITRSAGDSTNVEVLGVSVAHSQDVGLLVDNSTAILSGNEVHHSGIGVAARSASAKLNGNLLHDNELGARLHLTDADFTGNVLAHNGVAGLSVDASQVTLEGNLFEANRLGVQSSSGLSSIGNVVRGSLAEGVLLTSGGWYSENDVVDGNGVGLRLTNGEGHFSGLEAAGNRGSGLVFDGASGEIDRSAITNNSGDGAVFSSSRGFWTTGNSVVESTIADNGGNGILGVNMGHATIVASDVVARNGGWGVRLANQSSGDVVRSDVVKGNGAGGIQIENASGATVAGNAVEGNAGDGLDLVNATGLAFQGGSAMGNAGWGVRISASDQASVAGVVASHNGAGGMSLDHDRWVWNSPYLQWFVESVSVLSNAGPGIEVNATQNLTAHQDNLTGNDVGYQVTNSTGVALRGDRIVGSARQGVRFADDDRVGMDLGAEVASSGAEGVRFERTTGAFLGDIQVQDSAGDGIVVDHSYYVRLMGDGVRGNRGVGVRLNATDRFTVFGDRFIGNAEGAVVSGSTRGMTYGNDFENLGRNAHDDNPGANLWYNPPSGGYAGNGNYWSDYAGADLNGDGIGDTQLPYLQPGGDPGDVYPLMAPP